jgi:diguanylate cyclase (GGDEF)-like protein
MIRYLLTNNALLKKQVEPLFKATLSGGLGNILAAILVYLLLEGTANQIFVAQTCLIIIATSAFRIIISRRYLLNKTNLPAYLYSHVFLTFITGSLWGYVAYMQMYTNDDVLRNLIFLINFGLIAASIATLSTWVYAYIAYMFPQSLAIFYVFLKLDSEYSLQMAGAFVIFTGIMIITSIRYNYRIKKEVELIHNLNNEIGMREEAQRQLQNNKQDLEEKVNERTKELVDMNSHLESVIDKKEQAEKSLHYLAYHDELTGLPNKNLLVDRINQSIKTSSRDNQKIAILFLDLDRFKNINDSLGHTIGDILIKKASSRLHKILRSRDTLARNGGDEFVVVLERLKNTDEAVHVAKKVINSLTETFEIQAHKIHIGASVGISIYPTDGKTSSILIRNADTAMYKAKQSGGNQLQFYNESMSNQLRDRLVLESELHSALEKDEFYLMYQPQVNCLTGETTGFEILLRWSNSTYGEIGPDRFVPLLEETGLIYAAGEWVVTQVIDFIRTQPANNVTYSINLSVLQFNNYKFIDFVRNEIDKAGVDPAQIEFEITESLLINDFEKTYDFLSELHSIGCSIALDDFGTGYTSMSYLARLPIDVIKIDKSLVRNINEHSNLKSIVKAIVTMSKSLGMTNIFEGVETKAELAVIQTMKGNIIQGYLFSKPIMPADIGHWLSLSQDVNQAKVLKF